MDIAATMTPCITFSDLALSKRLERTEGYACSQFADARRRLFPDSDAEWIECAGAYAVFDGVDSPVTQSFGLGIFERLSPIALDEIERFFFDRGAPAVHEVSPFAGVAALNLLCARNYKPIEISNVLYRHIEKPGPEDHHKINVRVIGPEESQVWASISAKGWAHEHPELLEFLLQLGAITTGREGTLCFLGEIDGVPGAAGVLTQVRHGIAGNSDF